MIGFPKEGHESCQPWTARICLNTFSETKQRARGDVQSSVGGRQRGNQNTRVDEIGECPVA